MPVSATQLDALKQKGEKKQEQLEKVSDELTTLQMDLKKAATEFLKDCGLATTTTTNTTKTTTTKASKASKPKGGQRWREKRILEIINEYEAISLDELKARLQEDKPNAILDKLEGYLQDKTNNDATNLKLNAKGKRAIS